MAVRTARRKSITKNSKAGGWEGTAQISRSIVANTRSALITQLSNWSRRSKGAVAYNNVQKSQRLVEVGGFPHQFVISNFAANRMAKGCIVETRRGWAGIQPAAVTMSKLVAPIQVISVAADDRHQRRCRSTSAAGSITLAKAGQLPAQHSMRQRCSCLADEARTGHCRKKYANTADKQSSELKGHLIGESDGIWANWKLRVQRSRQRSVSAFLRGLVGFM